MNAYHWSLLPLTHCSHHSGEVGLPLLFVLVLGVPDQIRVDRLALIVALQSVQLHKEKSWFRLADVVTLLTTRRK